MFNDQYFMQTFGVAMGSALSPVLANLYMEYFESELLPAIDLKPLLWLRYVEDVCALWPNDWCLNEFLRKLNDLAPSIEFTVEEESYGVLPFLDTVVHRKSTGFMFSIFRKPTNSGMYLHFFSLQPLHVKKAVVFSAFLRALRICDPCFIDEEFSYIRVSFRRLGYPDVVISRALSDAKRRVYVGPRAVERDDTKPSLILPYSNNVKLLNPVKQPHNIQTGGMTNTYTLSS